MAKRITITVPDSVAEAAQRHADSGGPSVSAQAAQGLRNEIARRAGIAYKKMLADNPDIAEQLAAWNAAGERALTARWPQAESA